MLFLNVALTSRISTTMTIIGSSKFSHHIDGNSIRRIHFSWPKKLHNSNPVFFYAGKHVNLQIGYTGEKELRNCIDGKKARLT